MTNIPTYFSYIAGLAGCVSVILTAFFVQRAFVGHQSVSAQQITALSIVSIAAWTLRLVIDDVLGFIRMLSYRYVFDISVQLLILHVGLIIAGVLLLLSSKKSLLARLALMLQTIMLLGVALIHLGPLVQFLVLRRLSAALRPYLLPFVFAAALAVYPTVVLFQSRTKQQ